MAVAKRARGNESIIQVVIQKHYKDALLRHFHLQRNQTDTSTLIPKIAKLHVQGCTHYGRGSASFLLAVV